MLKTFLFVSLGCLSIAHQAASQEVDSLRAEYEVQIQDDGQLKVVPKLDFAEQQKAQDFNIEAGPSIEDDEDILEKLKGQDFWIEAGPSGDVSNVFVLPKGVGPPMEVMANAGSGASFTKYAGASVLAGVIPDSQAMLDVLSKLMTNAKTAVCNIPARPKEFGAAVDVSAGIGISGRIEFNVTWETNELCR